LKKVIVILLTALSVLFFSSCFSQKNGEPSITKTTFALNTVCTIRIYDKDAEEKIIYDAFDYIKSLENLLSRHIKTSDIAKINDNAGENYVIVDEQTLDLIKKCVYYSSLTDGAFDITLGSIIDLWDINSGKNYIPSEEDINLALKYTGYKNILIYEKNRSVKLAQKGVILDLGAAAKGYISQKTKEFLEKQGVKSAIIDFGGNIVILGKNNTGENFKIGIQTPFEERGNYIAVIGSEKNAIVSSGNYERYFKSSSGRIYHHILDPKTGSPVQNGLNQVTVICDDATVADILSTSIYVMGEKKGRELLRQLSGVEAVFVDDKNKVITTENIKNNIKIIN